MATTVVDPVTRDDWGLANPWVYSCAGLGLAVVGWVALTMLGSHLDGPRVFITCVGVLLAGVGIVVRLSSFGPAFIQRLTPETRRIALGLLFTAFGTVALSTTLLLLLMVPTVFGWEAAFGLGERFKFGGSLYLWTAAAPVSFVAAALCWKKIRTDAEISAQEEAAAILVVAGITAFCACWALYDPATPLRWDSFRTFLAAAVIVCLVAAPLAAAPQWARRLLVSVLILFHFSGILSAVFAAPPSPATANHLWGRIYRPYLEFMYLNNAYHFYAPEPGPASYLWFRLYFEDPEGNLHAHWHKVPRIDENGWHQHPVSLEYQRTLALTENAINSDPYQYVDAYGQSIWAKKYTRRAQQTPRTAPVAPVIGGKAPPPKSGLLVPFHPQIPEAQQYQPPTNVVKGLLESYARHVARMPHPTNPEWTFHSVKIYRVTHYLTVPSQYFNGYDVQNPELYRPFFLGEYDRDGNLVDPEEPFLYWMLPILRDDLSILTSDITSHVARHAGDPASVFKFNEKTNKHELLDPR